MTQSKSFGQMLKQLGTSKKFWIYAVALFLTFLVPFVPQLKDYAGSFIIIIPSFATVLITVIGHLDAKALDQQTPPLPTTSGQAISGFTSELKTAGLSAPWVDLLGQALQIAANSLPQPAPGTSVTVTSTPTADPASVPQPGSVG